MINTKGLRVWIGWLGMLLPIIVVVLQLLNPVFKWPTSISATWYTNACTPFMIILGSASVLLMCYKGYDWVDNILNTCGGCCGLLICLFPCWGAGYRATDPVGTFLIQTQTSNTVHSVAAFVFFGILAYNAFFQFTKSSGEMTRNKKIRNIIFRVCGVGMILAFGMLLLPSFRIRIWLLETIALFFFGISWLTKANCFKILFADEKNT
jgi:hypothetical protein